MWTDEQIGFHAFPLSKSNILKLYFANFFFFFNVLQQSTITFPELWNHVTSLYLEYVCTNVNRWTNWVSCFCTIEIECSGTFFRQFWLVFYRYTVINDHYSGTPESRDLIVFGMCLCKCKPMNKLAFMLLHFRNRMFWSFIWPILIGFLTLYGNQRSLFRNSGISWLNCIWNVFVLM